MSKKEKEIKDVINEKMLKVSFCQDCNGWVRAMSLGYFMEDKKARNEFMNEVGLYNLAVREVRLKDWQGVSVEKCYCK